MEHASIVNEFIIILAASVLVSALFHRLKIPVIISYLAVGVLVGPSGLGFVQNIEQFQIIAEFGVAFLLFTLGLEFSLARMLALRRIVFGLGSLQVLICIGVFGALIYFSRQLYDISLTGVLVVASAIALSSTAIVSKELTRRNEVATAHGQMAIGILLFQDIAAIVILVVISAGANTSGDSLAITLLLSGLKAALFFVTVVILGKWVLPPLFMEVSKTRSEELFVLTVLVVALVSASAAHALGLAMALGAFMAGMMLGESHFRHQIEAEVKPFRDLLLGIFFVSIGLIVNVELIISYWLRILFFSVCLIAFKTLLVGFLCRLFSKYNPLALRTGLILSQGGEFGFALLALAVKGHLVSYDVASFFISIIILSMAATPILVAHSEKIANWIFKVSPTDHNQPLSQEDSIELHDVSPHVILCGYGRVGQTIARFLRQENIPYIAIDNDSLRVKTALTMGENVKFGNLRNPKVLKSLCLDTAQLIVISFDDFDAAHAIIRDIKELNDRVPILVRTRDDAHLEELMDAGASEVIPETLEASLMLVSHIMTALGVANNRVYATIDQVRKDRYKLMQGFVRNSLGFHPEKETLHPIFLPANAFAVGKQLQEIPLTELKVRLHTLKRGKQILITPQQDLSIEAEDIIILAGEYSALEAAESYLLSGVK